MKIEFNLDVDALGALLCVALHEAERDRLARLPQRAQQVGRLARVALHGVILLSVIPIFFPSLKRT